MAEMPEPVVNSADRSARIDMGRVFGRLTVRERQLLWLAHVEGLSHREVSNALGLGEGSVRVLLFRARQKLAKLIRGQQG